MPRITTPGRQYFDRNGNPLSGGFLYTRETDGVTDKATYPTEADYIAGTNPNSNPVELDDEGQEPELWGGGDYWFNLKDANLVQQDTWPKSPVQVNEVVNTPNMFYGLTLSNNGTDAEHDIDIASGACMDTTGAVRINLTTAFTKKIDATWAAGTNMGGLASGATLSTSTFYHVFAVVVGGNADVMFDSSVTCANGVANNAVTSYQYINSVRTDSSSNILAFVNKGNDMWLDVTINSTNQSNPGTTTRTVTLATPTGIQTLANVSCVVTAGASGMGYILFLNGGQTATTPTSTLNDMGLVTSAQIAINRTLLTTTASAVQYKCSTGADGSVRINTLGWTIIR